MQITGDLEVDGFCGAKPSRVNRSRVFLANRSRTGKFAILLYVEGSSKQVRETKVLNCLYRDEINPKGVSNEIDVGFGLQD